MRRVLKPGGRVAAIVYATAENNRFFSIPVSVIRRRAKLPPPLPGQPGPFSLGGAGVLEEALRKAGFRNVESRTVPAPVRMASAAECVRFEQESFGALHQMLAGLDQAGRQAAWREIAQELAAFEGSRVSKAPARWSSPPGSSEGSKPARRHLARQGSVQVEEAIMSRAGDCLRKGYFRRYCVPPKQTQTPRDCTQVFFTDFPELTIFTYTPERPDWLDIHCAVPTAEGAGGVIMLLRLTGDIKWEISFINTSGKPAHEQHRVIASAPMLFKLQGPRMALNASHH